MSRFAVAFLVAFVVGDVVARRLPDIFWNSSNPIFDISNTDHVKAVRLLDRVSIVCPKPTAQSDVDYEFSKLFVVSREDYERCIISPSSRLLGVCATPQRQSTISVVFRDFSPLPSAIEFHPGQSYYVTATSVGTEEGLNATTGGLCLHKNMRIKFDILGPNDSEPAEMETMKSSRRFRVSTTPPTPSTTPLSLASRLPAFNEPITYIIHTVEPDQLSDEDSMVPFESRDRLIGWPDAVAAANHSPPTIGFLILTLFALLDMGWRRL